ncbi:uncharacterized protein LOC134693649 [Mytilus trossulus]|uniref:uncharacterized protein LOC134693649 n=1 Tax=Mytilus trossulus TaxID=6551 RepID=UPI0030040C83
MEFMDKGSLKELCNRVGCISDSDAKYITREILYGISYLHLHGIVHRDIKADNVVIDSFSRVKISDFGITKQPCFYGGVFGLQTQMIGTPSHMAPEIRGLGFPNVLYGFPADIWSLACTVIEIITGFPPQSENYFNSIFIGVQCGYCSIDAYRPTFSTDACWLFIKYALHPNQIVRPSAQSLLCHPWITMVMVL